MGGSREDAGRNAPKAACDSSIPAPECLSWHIAPRVPDAKLASGGRSLRCRCPNHDDHQPSLVISVGEHAPLTWYCHACGKDASLEVRAALISTRHISPKCLPMSRREQSELEEMVFAVYRSAFTPCTKLVCIRALHEGIRGALPRAPALIRLGERAGVSRTQVFRSASELRGASLNHLFVPRASERVKDHEVVSAFHGTRPVPDWDSVPNRDWVESQIGTGSPSPFPAA